MTVGERIRNRRKELGLTQTELGKKLGYGKSAVCRVECGGNNITTDRISKIAEALETTPGYLMGWFDGADENVTIEGVEDIELLKVYHMLNKEGKERVLLYARDLAKISAYCK